MRKTWKRIVSVVMALAMVVLCLPGYSNPVKTAKAAAAGDISYVDENGNTITLHSGEYTAITNYNQPTTLQNGRTYVIGVNLNPNQKTLNINNNRIPVSGNAKLIILSGYTANILEGIHVSAGNGSSPNSLTIYGAGTLNCNSSVDDYRAGIGGNYGETAGSIAIYGCTVNAKGGIYAAGIGGGYNGNGGTITIGGTSTVSATGGQYGAGIGGGYGSAGGTIAISGTSNVTATGGQYGAGIGSGYLSSGSLSGTQTISITGGTITATGGQNGSGIGSGCDGHTFNHQNYCGTISISGGTVNAKAGSGGNATGIGGYFGSNNNISISGGTVTATIISRNQTAIGGANNSNTGAVISISGGTVTTVSNLNQNNTGRSVGIGNGYSYNGNGGSVSIDFTDTSSVKSFNYKGKVTLENGAIIQESETELTAGQVSNLSQIANVTLVKKVVKKYTITWKDGDGNTLTTDSVAVGETPVYSGATPTKTATPKYSYEFNNTWSPAIVAVTKDATYTAQFDSTVNKYTITWLDGDGNTLKTESVAYDEVPEYSGATPTKTADAQYTYTFNETWSPAVAAVTGAQTYTALFDGVVNEYTITWKDGDDKVIGTSTVAYGETPAYTGATPTKTADAQYTYTFNDTWSPAIGAVTGNQTYVAQFSSTVNEYTITWKDGDGNVIGTDTVAYGVTPAYTGATPTKTATAQYSYTFNNTWSPAIESVTGDATYTAQFDETTNKYTVTFKDANGNNIIDPAQYDYNTPADEITVPEAPFKDADGSYVYTFSGWSPAITAVTGDATYTATYSTSPRQYSDLEVKVVWDDNDNRDGFRPDHVIVGLFQNGWTTVSTHTMYGNGNTWTQTFRVPTNDVKGNPFTYTLEPDSVDNYEETINGFTVTYKHTPETTEASVKVVWVDSNDEFSTRPNDLEVYLSDGEKVTLSSANNWAATINGLLKHENQGEVINYTWSELSVPGYELTNTTTEGTTTTFTFTLITTTVSGEVLWELKDNSVDLLPENVTVYIKDGDTTVDTITVSANTVGEWAFTSIELPKFRADGTGTTEISYTVSEAAVPRFATTISGTQITNTLNTCDVTVSISWDDADNQDGYRPNADGVEVTLIGDSVEVDTIVLNAENGWTHTWTDVPKEADINTDIQYTVEGATVSEYDLTLDDDDPYIKVLNYQHTPETTEVNIEVVWNDKDNQDGYRPDAITVNLLANNEIVENAELLAFDQSNSWLNLPKKANGENIDYTVTVEEDNLSEYSVAIDKAEGDNFKYTVTLNHEIEKTNVKVSKVWDDADNQDGYRPDYVTIRLLADSVEKDEVTLNEDNNWTYTWSDLDKKAGGVAIDYTVKEDGVVKYNAQITKAEDGTFTYTVTNTHEPEETEVKVSKVWNDADDQDGYRPDEVTINLLVNGSPEEYVTLNEDNNWTYTWTKLPKKADGSDIDYTVSEDDVDKYTKDIVKATDGTFTYTVTNTHETEETEVSVIKVWDDADDQDGYRPDDVTVNLLADGNIIDTVTLSAENEWSYSWTKLDKKADGSDIDYTVSEDEVAEYTANIVKATDGSFNYTVTNKHTTEKVEVTVSKVWEDSNDKEGFRPEGVTVRLYKGTEAIDSAILGINNNWTHTWYGLAKNDNGVAIDYKVTEDPVANYSTEITKATDGTFTYTVTNSRTVEYTQVSVEKIWDDSDNKEGFRPESVTVKLLANGEEAGTATLNADNEWKYTWADLQKYVNGQEVTFTVSEDQLANYKEPVIEKVSETAWAYTVTNSRDYEETEVNVTKVWDDSDNSEGFRPASVTINLMKGSEKIGSVELNQDNNWTYTWTELQKYENGVAINYTVTEDSVDNYSTRITKATDGTFTYTVTNSRTVEKTEVSVEKIWDDSYDIEGFRPDSVTIKLFANGEEAGAAALDSNNNWKYTWTDLQKFENGEEIEYTVSEDQIERYEAPVIEKVSETAWSYTVTNSRTVEKTSVSVEKIWDDTDNAEGFRPASVTIKLFANGEEAGSVMLDADNNWKYILTDLQKFAEGKEIVYTVSEDQLANYKTPVIEKVSETEWSYTVTNSRDLEVTEATVKTAWVDADDQDGYRPESLTVKLLANGGETNKSVTLNEENGWEAKLTGLQKYADHEGIEYTWVEEGLPEKYSLTNSETVETITTLTNSHTPEETEATVKVIWNLDAKEIKNPPEALTVWLSDGQTVELNAENNWSATIEHLPKYRNHGEEIEYTWEEVDLPEGYELTDTSKDGTITTLTNTYYVKPTKLPLEATKILTGRMWTEEDNFEFTLAADENNPEGAELPKTTVKYAYINSKSVVFDNIVFNKYGTFKFTITETEGNIKGVTYDTEPKEFTVVIKDDGIGTLYVDSVTNDGYVEIKNPYESCGEIQFFAKKIMIGRELAEGQYTFALKDEDGNTLQTASCDAEGKVTFAPITYSEDDMVVDGKIVTERQYTYTISEVKPEGDELDKAVIYDGAVKEITVTLTDDQEGTITTDPETGDLGITFINTVVRIQKTDVATGEELTGAHLKILDKTGTVIDEWDSETGKPHEVENLKTDEAYTLTESTTPKDYTFAADATFSVDKDGKITTYGLKVREDGVLLLENKLAEKPTFEVKTQDVNDTTGETSGWQDSADYDNGDEVPFRLTAMLADNVTDYRAYKIIFHDTMDAGLTFKSIDKVTVGGQELSSNDYSIDSDDNNFDLTILWNNSDGRIADESLNEAVIEVLFTAVLNENAELGMEGNSNICTLEYSCNPNVSEDGVPSDETEVTDADSVIVFTYGIELTVSGESGEAVDDAEFELVKKVDGNELTVATVTVVDGQVSFVGIDDGEYILKQTNVPDKTVGIDPISFTVSAEHSAVWEEPEIDTVLSALDGNVTEGDLTLTADESYSILSGDITLQTISYKITFCDENGNVLSSEEYKNGTKAADVSIPKAPEKQSDDEKNYVFSAWVNATTNVSGVADVTEEATYKATYTDSSRKYVITFVNEDGTELQSGKVAYGETPKYDGAAPTKASDDKYDYTFEDWSPAIADVTGDATYTAKFKATEIKKDPVKGVYKYIGEAAKYTKGSKKAVTIIFKRTENDEITFDMFAGVKTAKGNLVSGTHYTAKKGSVEITLLPDYLETLEVGKTAITVSFQDGDPVTIELEVAPAQQQADTNPTTGDSLNMNYIWIICVIGATALAVLIFVQVQRRRREEEF